MNSRLNLNIREKYGLAYNIEASYTPYSDTGFSRYTSAVMPAIWTSVCDFAGKRWRLWGRNFWDITNCVKPKIR